MHAEKKFLSALMSIVLVIGLLPAPALAAPGNSDNGDLAVGVTKLSASYRAITAQAANTVSRGEWVGKLVETFGITVESEEEYPEDYFSDLVSSNAHYYDFLKAVDFGIIDVAAGDPVYPDDPATREFAAQTLNYCLGFQLDEGTTYTFSDSSGVPHADDLQVAVNREWFALSDGKVNPSAYITADEASKMVSDASEVWHSTDDLVNAEDNVVLADDVKVVPEATEIEFSVDGKTVNITNCPIGISTGDKFAVYVEGFPTAYKAASVSKDGTRTIVVIENIDASEGYKTLVYGSTEEYDLSRFQEDSGVSTQSFEDIDAVAASGINTGGITVQSLKAQGVSYRNGSLKYKAKFSHGYVEGAIAGMKINKSVNLLARKYYVSISGSSTLTASVNGSVETSVPLGAVWFAGCTSTFSVFASVEGSLTKTVSANFEVGIQYDPTNKFRIVKTFRKGKPGISVTAKARIGYDVSTTIGVPGISATVGAGFGFEANYSYNQYPSGTPVMCQDIECHVYAEGYAYGSFGVRPASLPFQRRFPVWDASNSPVRMHKHIEDGVTVGYCHRGMKYTYGYWRSGLGSNYGSKWGSLMWGPNGSGTEWGYNDAGEWVEYATYEYTLDSSNKATITKYHGNSRALLVPETIDGYDVVGVGARSFQGNQYLISLTLPDSVTSIGSQAFMDCSSLSSVSLPSSLKTLGSGAFQNDDSLASITIPASLESCSSYSYSTGWGYGPFYGCDGLKKVKFASGTKRVAGRLLRQCPGIESVVVPEGVTTIDSYAFSSCPALKSVSLPSTLTSIEERAFESCSSLSTLKLPESLTAIKVGAFSYCGLSEAAIPNSVTDISGDTFYKCTSLTKATIGSSITTIPAQMFYGCSSLNTVSIPESITSIGQSAFQDCSNLGSIELSTGLSTIGYNAFKNCDSLSSITIPNSVASFGTQVFYDCDALKNVDLGTGITTIPSEAFRNCDSLEAIVLPYRVAKIDSNAFSECTNLSTITIPNATTSIASNAFSYPTRMTVYGVAGSAAETWANNNGATFVANTKTASAITLSQSEVTMLKGKTLTLTASIEPKDFTGDVVWKSSNTDIVTVDATGKLTAKATGSTTVKLAVGEQAAVCKVTVLQPVTSISLNMSSYSMEAADILQLTATVNPSDANDKTVKWASSDETVATVDQTGKVTAIKKGAAKITVAAQDGSEKTATCNITVTNDVVIAGKVSQLESAHPYENNCQDAWVYKIPDAKSLNVTFDSRTSVEDGGDFIRVYSGNGEEVGSWTGAQLAGKTIAVPGNTLKIRLATDAALTDWGFKVNSVISSSGDEGSGDVDGDDAGGSGSTEDPADSGRPSTTPGGTKGGDTGGSDSSNSSDSGSDSGALQNGLAGEADVATGIVAGQTASVDGATYKVNGGVELTVEFQAAPKGKKSVKVPAKVTINGKTYQVTSIAKGAFKASKAKTVTIASKKLTKKSVKGCFKASKVKTVKVPKSKLKAYKKIFTKKNCGAKVKVVAK